MIRILGYAAGLGMLGFGSHAAAYRTANGILIDRKYWEGYQPRFQYNQLVPNLIGCSIPEDDNTAFAVTNNYTDAAIACHIGATPAPLSAPTQAGATVSLALNPWSPGHKGPVITFLANCQGPYKTIDPLALKFFKIEELSLLGQPDDQYNMIAGNHVLWHALHRAHFPEGAQNYPQCINLLNQGPGTANPKGVPATELYTPDSVHCDIWIKPLPTYTRSSPPLYTGDAGGGSGNSSEFSFTSSSNAAETSIPSGSVTILYIASSSTLSSATAAATVAATASKAESVDNDDTCEP